MNLQQIVSMLQMDNHYLISDEIEIAKGKYKLHNSLQKMIKQAKRELINKRNGRN